MAGSYLIVSRYDGVILMSNVLIFHYFEECQQTAASLQEFSAVGQLSARLGDSLVMAEEMLDGALAKQCNNFQPEIYSKLQVLHNIAVTQIQYYKNFSTGRIQNPRQVSDGD